MTFKKIIGKLHLWLGLASGLVVFIVSITGCIYTFQHELQDLTQPYRFVKEVKEVSLPPSEIKALGEKTYEGKTAQRLYLLSPERSAMVMFYGKDYYHVVFVDQYTGEVLKSKNMKNDFFTIVLAIHMTLLLPGAAGELVVPIATLVFVVMLITGILLWWPKNKAAAPKSFKIKWNARWRRKNYDLHNILGFYASWIAILIALTGLMWGFSWFQDAVYWTASGGKTTPAYPRITSDTLAQKTYQQPLDLIVNKLNEDYSGDRSIVAMLPASKSAAYSMLVNEHVDRYWKSEYRFFDQFTAKEYPSNSRYGKFEEASVADKILKLNYDIHTGGIFGFFGKCIAFLASLIAASLPVTGFIIWWGRRKKNKKDEKSGKTINERRQKILSEGQKPKMKPKIRRKKEAIAEV